MNKKTIISLLLLISFTLPFFCGCLDESEPSSEQDYLTTINNDGLIGYWRFDEAYWTGNQEEVEDSSGRNNHGTIFETAQVQPGKLGKGLARFDGINDYIFIENSDSLEPEEITVETWVKKTESTSFEYLVSKGASADDHSSYALYTDEDGGLSFYITDGISVAKSPHVDSSLWDGSWHHIAGSFDGSTVRLYVDGEEVGSGSDYNISIGYNLTTQNDLYFGNYNGSITHPLHGDLDEVLIWNKALNATEILQHYTAAKEISSTVVETSTSLTGLKEEIRQQLSGLTHSDLVIIKGNNLSIQEELLMYFAQQQLPDLTKIESVYDTDITNISEFASNYQKIIFLGGNKTNEIIRYLLASNHLEIEEQYLSTPFVASFGTSYYLNKDVIIFSTGLETTQLENKGPDRSPLSQIMDKRLTPIVATIASITIIHLANLFGSTISEFFFDFTSEKLGERKKRKHDFKEKKKTSKKSVVHVKEIASILVAIIVLSLSLSWTWSTDLSHFYSLLLINLFVVSIFYLIREGLRVRYSKKYSLITEHVFWPLGSILTFFSTILGNTFSLASYIALENEEKEKRYSRMYFTIFSILFGLTLLTFILNILVASEILQMFYTFTIMAVFIDMTPIQPMDGYEIKKHNMKRWIALYIPVFIVYLVIMFSTLL